MPFTPEELAQIRLEDKQDRELKGRLTSDENFQFEWRKVYKTYTTMICDEYTDEWDEAHGLTGLHIRHERNRYGQKHHSKYTRQVIDKILLLKNRGMSFDNISTRLKIPRPSVSNIYYKYRKESPSR